MSMKSQASQVADMPLALDADAVGSILGISRWSVYQAIRRGEIRAIRIGRSVRVPRSALAELLGETAAPSTGGLAPTATDQGADDSVGAKDRGE